MQPVSVEAPLKIRQQESRALEQACAGNKEGSKLGKATRDHYMRLDAVIASSMAATKTQVDCQRGCDYCCYYKVSASANEIFLISTWMQTRLPAERVESILVAARENAARIAHMTTAQHLSSNIQCPLLVDGACSIYDVRPAMCRKHHSLNVALCKQSYEHPEDISIPNPEEPQVGMRALAAIAGAREGIERAGLDAGLYDLSTALLETFTDNKPEKRWRKGKKAFSKAAAVS
ncbi:MAG: YkgJ family cysteine cluster protein [Gammaproteobacteria bacterium]|nr:YkgJ family cysteine cluster protein [Gammaproteobacteria bacterium]MDP2141806.1 YkgJ family cysteine cluster protein [Gammaproteobacteria bacterium]MDP2348028.1 YkgJ family cysteine cluster protein [Gammaproteobacteria bacterium]